MKPAGRRQKGCAGEREVVKLLHGAKIPGRVLTARRVPLSGADSNFKGDVLVGKRCPILGNIDHDPTECLWCGGTGTILGSEERIEVKRCNLATNHGRAAVALRNIYPLLDDNFALIMRGDRREWVLCIRLEDCLD
jgi:hypothetical protein